MHSYIVLLFNKARALPHQNFRKPHSVGKISHQETKTDNRYRADQRPQHARNIESKKTHIQLGTYREKRRKQHDDNSHTPV